MNQGGEQGHDDYGLPPVDVEIPDDASELYRDVQAYHRELRALRRHERSMRWRAPFRRSGVAIPLLAGCLIAALVAVMISAMFAQNPYYGPNPGQPPNASSASGGAGRSPRSATSSGNPSTSAPGGQASAPSAATHLPGKTIKVAGKPVPLRTLISAALAIIPANCRCSAAVRQLLEQAQSAGVIVYLVSPRGSDVATLNRLATQSAPQSKSTRVATDDDNVLTSVYPAIGLTVLLVDSHGLVTVDPGLGPKLMLEKQLQLLRPPGRG